MQLASPPRSGRASTAWVLAVLAGLGASGSSAKDAVNAENRIRQILGPTPSEICYRGVPAERHLRALYWAGEAGRGVLLVAPRGPWKLTQRTATGARSEQDAAQITFGAEPL
jgi:hypothetical protein